MKPPLLLVMMQLARGLGNLSSCRLKWNQGVKFSLQWGSLCREGEAATQCLVSLQTSVSFPALRQFALFALGYHEYKLTALIPGLCVVEG